MNVLVDVCLRVEIGWHGGGSIDYTHSAEGEGEVVLLFGHFGGEDCLAGGVVCGDELRQAGCGEDRFLGKGRLSIGNPCSRCWYIAFVP